MFLCACFVFACKKDNNDDLNNLNCSKIQSSYKVNIKPIIDANCNTSGCHNSGSKNGELTTYSSIQIMVNNGKLDKRVVQLKNMPLKGPLPIEEIKIIKCWLNSGAPQN